MSALCRVWGQMETFQRYSNRDGIGIAYVTDFELDSVDKLDVILIVAFDSSAWTWLKREFGVAPEFDSIILLQGLGDSIDLIGTFFRDRQDPTHPPNDNLMDNVTVRLSSKKKDLCIFYYRSEEQDRKINRKLLDSLTVK